MTGFNTIGLIWEEIPLLASLDPAALLIFTKCHFCETFRLSLEKKKKKKKAVQISAEKMLLPSDSVTKKKLKKNCFDVELFLHVHHQAEFEILVQNLFIWHSLLSCA